jgi:hypothetical protein
MNRSLRVLVFVAIVLCVSVFCLSDCRYTGAYPDAYTRGSLPASALTPWVGVGGCDTTVASTPEPEPTVKPAVVVVVAVAAVVAGAAVLTAHAIKKRKADREKSGKQPQGE